MFNWLKKDRKYAYFSEVLHAVNENFRQDAEIVSLKKELHGWQSAMYTLCDALRLDLVKDEHGNVVIQYRHPETVKKP